MSYTKQNFASGQTLEAEHLNHIEEGIAANEAAIAEKQPKGNYATEAFVTQKVSEAQLGGEEVDLSAYATKQEVADSYQPKGNYLTEHQQIKTVNGQSLVGTGNIVISGDGSAATSYWSGKKLVCNGDSIPQGAKLTSRADAFPYLVANALGMTLTNYAIGGSTFAKQPNAYDECYVDLDKFNADKNSGALDKSKKYLVHTATGVYQVYSWTGSTWSYGSTTNATTRTPLSDRIYEMDTDADVVLIACGTNDFYYNWTPFGDISAQNYRGLGEDSSGSTGDVVIGEIDMTVNLVKSTNAKLVDNTSTGTGGAYTDNEIYFTYEHIPVYGGAQLYIPKGRNVAMFDADLVYITSINFTSSSSVTNFTYTIPANVAYISPCAKKEEVTAEDFAVYQSKITYSDSGDYENGSENNETFYNALHKTMRYLLNTYKNKDIIFTTPIKRVQTDEAWWECRYPEDANTYGKTLKDYRDAIIEVCGYYSIPCIDLYALSGLNPHIDPSLFADADKAVHPNEAGHERIASLVIGYLEGLRK